MMGRASVRDVLRRRRHHPGWAEMLKFSRSSIIDGAHADSFLLKLSGESTTKAELGWGVALYEYYKTGKGLGASSYPVEKIAHEAGRAGRRSAFEGIISEGKCVLLVEGGMALTGARSVDVGWLRRQGGLEKWAGYSGIRSVVSGFEAGGGSGLCVNDSTFSRLVEDWDTAELEGLLFWMDGRVGRADMVLREMERREVRGLGVQGVAMMFYHLGHVEELLWDHVGAWDAQVLFAAVNGGVAGIIHAGKPSESEQVWLRAGRERLGRALAILFELDPERRRWLAWRSVNKEALAEALVRLDDADYCRDLLWQGPCLGASLAWSEGVLGDMARKLILDNGGELDVVLDLARSHNEASLVELVEASALLARAEDS